jgi:hypothetical protein
VSEYFRLGTDYFSAIIYYKKLNVNYKICIFKIFLEAWRPWSKISTKRRLEDGAEVGLICILILEKVQDKCSVSLYLHMDLNAAPDPEKVYELATCTVQKIRFMYSQK